MTQKPVLSASGAIALNKLRPAQKTPSRKIVGRGPGSGLGKTSGRGHKGQKSRAGVAIKAFEGGQMPLLRRVPKRGFVNIFKKEYALVNIDDIQRLLDQRKVDPTQVIDMDALKKAGAIRDSAKQVKLLARGELNASGINLSVHRASQQAIQKIASLPKSSVTILPAREREH